MTTGKVHGIDGGQLFSESPSLISEMGVMGVGISLRATQLRIKNSFRDFASPFFVSCGSVDTAFDLAFLSEAKTPNGLFCFCHGHVVGEFVEVLSISLRRKPEKAPPEKLSDISRRLGGLQEKRFIHLNRQENRYWELRH